MMRKNIWAPAAVAVLYAAVILIQIANVRRSAELKNRRLSDFAAFSQLISKIPDEPAIPSSAEPLLLRLQKSVEQFGLKDRSPKWSSGSGAPGQPSTVTLSLEGVPFDAVSQLLERFSADAAVAVVLFKIERSGPSGERFDLSASFVDLSGRSVPRAS